VKGSTGWRRVARIESGAARAAYDRLAVEEPLEIRIGGEPVSVTMRTPGADFDLVVGFLLGEGMIGGAEQVRSIRYCPSSEGGQYNVVDVSLAPDAAQPAPTPRAFLTTSSCGLCGKSSIEEVRARAPFDVRHDELLVSPRLLSNLPARLRQAQPVFARTGGLHAAGLFDRDGRLLCGREDVGRHNAFDKVIGWAATERRIPLRGQVMLASGRASFELTQKALVAGAPVLVAVSAPSSLAVALAEEAGMTLVGFLRGDTMNVYPGHHRVGA
jgi:FdhD protein